MALVKFTAIVDNISGKIKGTVFGRNKAGAYARGKGNPTNPQTASQSAVRAIFALIAQAWRGLTPIQRAAWDNATDDYPYQNRLGDARTLSGSGLHQKLNLNLASVDEDSKTTPSLPSSLELPSSFKVDLNIVGGTMEIEAPFQTLPVGKTKFALYATEPSSAGRTNLKNRLRKIGVVGSDVLDTYNVLPEYSAKFGAPIEGSNIAFEIRPVEITTGQGSAAFYTVLNVIF